MLCHHGVRHHFCHLAAPRNPSPHTIKTEQRGKRASFRIVRKGASLAIMGLLTVIKKVKAKEKEIRLLMV